MPRRRMAATASSLLLAAVLAAPGGGTPAPRSPAPADAWPMWGGSPSRNMVSAATGLPERWDVKTGENVKWVQELGSQSYGALAVAGGKVFAGTNNERLRNPSQAGDRGVVKAFRADDGAFLWQMTHEKLPTGAANDWPHQGVASTPLVARDRLYYVSNRAEVVCLDTAGSRVWSFDMIGELGVYPHNLANGSPVGFEDLVFVSTANGVDESHENVPAPQAPALVALDAKTGTLVWRDASPGGKILHGQWASPTLVDLGGEVQVVLGQGDGWARGFEARSGRKLWEFDLNPKDAVWPRDRNEIVATAVAHDGLVYLASGQDPDHGDGPGHLYAIDPSGRGDITESGRVWHFGEIRRSLSTVAVADGILYAADFSGFLHALDAKTGERFWVHDLFAAVWGSPVVADGKVYLGDEDGDVVVLRHSREKQVLAEMNMGASIYGPVVPAAGVLFVPTRNRLFALEAR